MVITRRYINGHTTYTLDGEKVSRGELEARCAKYFSVYGMRSMFKRLLEQDTLFVEIESTAIYEKCAQRMNLKVLRKNCGIGSEIRSNKSSV